MKNWLYRIATNVCIDEIQNRGRRARPMEEGAAFSGAPSVEDLVQRPASAWIEPISDARALPSDADPAERAILKQSIRLAFIAALQKLAPKQRAVLLLIDVLGFSSAEAAEALDTSVASINSALLRARAGLSDRCPNVSPDLTDSQKQMLNRYVAAFESYDIDVLTSLLRQDAMLSMPPYALLVSGSGSDSELDARLGLRLPRLAIGAGCCVRFASARPVQAESGRRAQSLGAYCSGTHE